MENKYCRVYSDGFVRFMLSRGLACAFHAVAFLALSDHLKWLRIRIMLPTPGNDGRQYRRQALSLLRQETLITYRALLVRLSGNQSRGFQFLQPVREYIGRDFFRRGQKLLVASLA